MYKMDTNIDLMNDLMLNQPHQAVSQTFILMAIKDYCQQVLRNKKMLIESEEEAQIKGIIPNVPATTWIEVADNINDKLYKFYNR